MKPSIEQLPDDPETLRRMLLDALQQNMELKQKNHDHAKEIRLLKQQIALYLAQKYGRRTEIHPGQGSLFNEAESEAAAVEEPSEETTTIAEHNRRKGGRRPIPGNLPREEVVIDLPPEEKFCNAAGCNHAELQRIGEEISEQYDIVPSRIFVLKTVRPKYACPCCREGVKIAPAPLQPIPKSNASPGILAHIAVSKYADGLPLYRQEKILERLGVDLSRATTSKWMVACAEILQPIFNLIRDHVFDTGCMYCDETVIQVLKEADKSPGSKSFMWVLGSHAAQEKAVCFFYSPSRSGKVARALLEDYQGFLHTDGYQGYNNLPAGIRRVGCLAHARRKFHDATKAGAAGAEGSIAAQALTRIQKIYAVEKQIRHKPPEIRKSEREKLSLPLLDDLYRWLVQVKDSLPPKSLTGRACAYLLDEWPFIIRFLEDGRLEVDTNWIERQIKPFVIGRKAWLFADTPNGAEASAILYSVIETCSLNNLDPFSWLRKAFTELPYAQTLADYEALLPWNFKKC